MYLHISLISSISACLPVVPPPCAVIWQSDQRLRLCRVCQVPTFRRGGHYYLVHSTSGHFRLELCVNLLEAKPSAHSRLRLSERKRPVGSPSQSRFLCRCWLQLRSTCALQVEMQVLRCTILLVAVGLVLTQPLQQGTVPNDQYTAPPSPQPLGSEGWRTGRSTFFDGSDSFKNAYLARYSTLLLHLLHYWCCKYAVAPTFHVASTSPVLVRHCIHVK